MIYIRILLSSVLLWFVYGETGPWTTAAIGFMTLSIESFAYWMRLTNKNMKRLNRLAEKI